MLQSCYTENTDTTEKRTCWYELQITDKKHTAVVCGLHKLPQCLYTGRGSVSMDNREELNTAQWSGW